MSSRYTCLLVRDDLVDDVTAYVDALETDHGDGDVDAVGDRE